jgi:hypothetical protein
MREGFENEPAGDHLSVLDVASSWDQSPLVVGLIHMNSQFSTVVSRHFLLKLSEFYCDKWVSILRKSPLFAKYTPAS